MINKLINRVKNDSGDNLLSLSGEVLITAQSGYEKNLLDMALKKLAECVAKELKQKYGFLTINITQGILDIGIKIFAYEKRVADKKFLDDFNESLFTALKKLYEYENLVIRVNIFGSFDTVDKKITYRYINKAEDVRYMVLEETAHKRFYKFLTPKIYVAVICILVLSYCGYLYYLKYISNNV